MPVKPKENGVRTRCAAIANHYAIVLGRCGPGKLTETGKFPKVLRGGCKRSFGPREQRSPKSLLHHPKLLFLHRCQMGVLGGGLFGDLCSLRPKDLLHPPLSTFGRLFPFRSISQARSVPTIVNLLRRANLLRRSIFSTAGSLVSLQFPNAAILNAVGRRKRQNERKRAQMSLTLQPSLFWSKAREPPKNARVFLFADPVNLWKRKDPPPQKKRKIGEGKKQGNRKKQDFGGSRGAVPRKNCRQLTRFKTTKKQPGLGTPNSLGEKDSRRL